MLLITHGASGPVKLMRGASTRGLTLARRGRIE